MCDICGGVSKCPLVLGEDILTRLLPLREEDYLEVSNGEEPDLLVWKRTHRKKRLSIYVRIGHTIRFGSTDINRLAAHDLPAPTWVGQCDYALSLRGRTSQEVGKINKSRREEIILECSKAMEGAYRVNSFLGYEVVNVGLIQEAEKKKRREFNKSTRGIRGKGAKERRRQLRLNIS